MPIKTRIDMLSTGIKTPVGIKLMGEDLQVLSDLGEEIEAVMRQVPGTLSVYAERVTGGNYLDFHIKRTEAARYRLDRRRCPGHHHDRHRRDEHYPDRRRIGTLSGQSSLLEPNFGIRRKN